MTSAEDVVFPVLPCPGPMLADDPFWRYPSKCASDGIAHLRVWSCPGQARLAIVSETGLGVSITNSIECIWQKLTQVSPGNPTLLEHWPPGAGGPVEHLDQVVVIGGVPSWRRVWPTPAANPRHEEFGAWMRDHGHRLLAAAKT